MYGTLNGDWSWELRVDGEGVKGLRGVVWFRENLEITLAVAVDVSVAVATGGWNERRARKAWRSYCLCY